MLGDALDGETIRMFEDDSVSLPEGDTDVLQLILGDENLIIDEDAPSDGTPSTPLPTWDSRELARAADQLARYRPSS